MLDKFRLKKNEKGFTLIELLIVVAIIGILAAIAIPQFASYRQRAFNSAALSDLRNVATGQESLFADTQGYGDLSSGTVLTTADPTEAAAVLAEGPLPAASDVVSGAYIANAFGTHGFSISNGVVIGGSVTNDGGAAGSVLATSYVLVAKHTQGDVAYGKDSDSSATFRANHEAKTALVAADIPAAAEATAAAPVDLTGDTGKATGWRQM